MKGGGAVLVVSDLPISFLFDCFIQIFMCIFACSCAMFLLNDHVFLLSLGVMSSEYVMDQSGNLF
jgi:hypothetical protein